MTAPSTFDPAGVLPVGLTALEASAGTGKTFALSALAVRFIAERDLQVGALCVVSFTEAATAELRGRIRTRLVDAAEHLAAGAPPTDDPVLAAVASTGRDRDERDIRLRRVRTAIAEFDAATITTIHGFCTRLLGGTGAALADSPVTDGGTDVDEVVNDLMIERFADRPEIEIRPPQLVAAVRTRLAMPDAEMQTFPVDPLAAGASSKAVVEHDRKTNASAMAALVDEACEVVLRRRAAGRRRTFDGLLVDARDLLAGPAGAGAIAALRQRYRLVLIDEFQDTDRVQWDIFRRAFVGGEDAPTTVLVGDPKQSIYRFRAAELSAYLDAVGHADTPATLATNWRSDAPLLDALGHLFTGFTFGSSAVAFQPVEAAPGHAHRRIEGAGSSSLELRWVDRAGEPLDVALARTIVRRDVVAAVIELLEPTASGAAGVTVDDGHGGMRPLCARDIAILTRSNKDAALVALDLGAAGIPAATASSNSVLDSEAASQWAILLRALERPGSVGAARAAALGWFVGRAPNEMAVIDDDGLAELHDQLRDWSLALAQRGVPRLLSLAGAAGLHERLLTQHGGERHLTDIDHIAELLQSATGGRPVGASALLALLIDGAGTDEEANASDLLARRIDRDDDAVQVLTVHKSKGLEFPVVLCPYLWTPTAGSTGIPHAQLEGRRLLDSSWVANAPQLVWNRELRDANVEEIEGEQRRLLYVALTRARHRCIVWWAPCTSNKRSVLGDLLRHASGAAEMIEPPDLGPVLAAAGDTIGITPVVRRTTRQRLTRVGAVAAALDVASASRHLDRTWRNWSFSAMKSAADDVVQAAGGAAGVAALEGALEGAPIEGGADEPILDDPGDAMAADELGAGGVDDAVAPVGLALAPGGTEFGTLVHEVLEVCDFTSEHLREDLVAVCDERLRFRTFRVGADELAAGLVRSIEAPLGGPVGGLRLRDVGRLDRLDELGFDMPLGRLHAAEIGTVLARHLASDDPLRPWAQGMAAAGFDVDVSGMLNGSIDLILRTDRGTRFWVADYKTNQLGVDSGYSRAEMADAMAHHHYPLQASLYLVALHRYLRWRLPQYEPARHLGGAAYLFLRGMDPARGADDARGVFWWEPPAAAVLALDELLTGAGVR